MGPYSVGERHIKGSPRRRLRAASSLNVAEYLRKRVLSSVHISAHERSASPGDDGHALVTYRGGEAHSCDISEGGILSVRYPKTGFDHRVGHCEVLRCR